MTEISPKGSGIPLSKSEARGLIKKHLDEFPPNLSAHLNSNHFYEEKYQYLTKIENKYPERLKIGLDLSNSKQLLTYKNRLRTFHKTIKEKGTEYFKVAKIWLIPEDNDSLETYLLQLHTSLVIKKKTKLLRSSKKKRKILI